ncbi:MAG: ferredoxin-thioredoxin reductase catalytic domain-containing protein [Brevinematia bacterium]
MKEKAVIKPEEVEAEYRKLNKEAEEGGYHLNPDVEFTKALVEGLIVNTIRYGYPACPCRLASGKKDEDLDIICPCDYRDADLDEYGTCYCGLYVSLDVVEGKKKISSIPDRRAKRMDKEEGRPVNLSNLNLKYPVWRCKVCGYLCARDNPPEVCPICKAKKERFERFI